jgi:uncharacterized membrane protein
MSDKIVQLLKSSNSYTAKIKTSSSLNSLLWLMGILVFPISFSSTYILIKEIDSIFPYLLFTLFSMVVFVFLIIFIYFAIAKPDNLRSESFVIEKMKTELIANQIAKNTFVEDKKNEELTNGF